MKRSTLIIILVSLGAFCLGTGFIILAYWFSHKPPVIPSALKIQATFPVLVIKQDHDHRIDPNSIKYDSQQQLLSYTVHLKNGTKFASISEQTSPNVLNINPQFFDNATKELHAYDNFKSSIGNVILTHPDNTKGETAIINAAKTLMFVQVEQDLNERQWQSLVNKIEPIN